jgi:hypothetical protein
MPEIADPRRFDLTFVKRPDIPGRLIDDSEKIGVGFRTALFERFGTDAYSVFVNIVPVEPEAEFPERIVAALPNSGDDVPYGIEHIRIDRVPPPDDLLDFRVRMDIRENFHR